MDDMGKSPNTNRQEAVQKLLTAAGAKLVAMYYTRLDRLQMRLLGRPSAPLLRK
jgi:ferritin-like protein